jgi:hypothetical protein
MRNGEIPATARLADCATIILVLVPRAVCGCLTETATVYLNGNGTYQMLRQFCLRVQLSE